ncbi:MAG: metal-dependent hydrolase [Pseudomonadota bacterium]
MRISWMGHGSFRIEVGGQVLLLDPWINGNPVFPEGKEEELTGGATHILITHGHFDHTADCVDLAKKTGAPIIGMYELANWFGAEDGVEAIGANKGGTVMCGDVAVTMVAASHSSTVSVDDKPVSMGMEVGYMISYEGKTLYAMGDTDIMADWEWMGELHQPDFAIVPVGGHFTMDDARAAWGIKRYLPSLKAVIAAHYKTFPLLKQDANALVSGIAPMAVHELDFGGSVDL